MKLVGDDEQPAPPVQIRVRRAGVEGIADGVVRRSFDVDIPRVDGGAVLGQVRSTGGRFPNG